jgi:hypothetical protein
MIIRGNNGLGLLPKEQIGEVAQGGVCLFKGGSLLWKVCPTPPPTQQMPSFGGILVLSLCKIIPSPRLGSHNGMADQLHVTTRYHTH